MKCGLPAKSQKYLQISMFKSISAYNNFQTWFVNGWQPATSQSAMLENP